ncbi:hypothetical protein AZ66_20810 [Paenibacillus sp. E194]|uniref:hypothetical protein n=1 Tax=Paenibacillus sp. E194 TaxID=1458845 RepID=UPI0005C911A1|nr:hypothetical protein [Paenibacillus sp. E194]KJB86104.1 hypothetical protein AZ66_20810 [Paenibacillus sp. E194]
MKWLAKRGFNIPHTGINKIEKVQIGGIEQYILVQSIREGLPILLMLHGGPGLPLPGVSCRGRHDVHVHGQFVETFCAELEAPAGKRLIWMDKSAHMFHLDDAHRIEQELIEIAIRA